MSQLEITSCNEQIDISVFEDLSITIPDEFNGQSITVQICQDSLVVSFFDPTPFPAFLFAAGEQGAWYDPSDFSTMFQDSAGTTPVTAVEQPVGLLLDRSKNGVGTNGAERLNLLNYSEQFNDAAWAKAQATVSANSTVAPDGTTTADSLLDTAVSNIHYTSQSIASVTVSGVSYTARVYAKANTLNYVTIGISDISSGSLYAVGVFNLSNGTLSTSGAAGTGYTVVGTPTITSVGDGWYLCSVTCTPGTSKTFLTAVVGINKTGVITAAAGGFESYLGNGSGIFVWGADFRLTSEASTAPTYQPITASWALTIPGNHASQSTSASRPVLSARVNLLTYSEQFENAAWVKTGLNTTGTPPYVNVATSPDGTQNADFMIEDTANSQHTVRLSASMAATTTHTYLFFAKAAGRTNIAVSRFNSAVVPSFTHTFTLSGSGTSSGGSITALANDWYRCSGSFTTTGAGIGGFIVLLNNGSGTTYTGDGTSGIYIWGADLRPTNQTTLLPAYQRIAAATDYDTTGFPLYLRFDGTDDFFATGSIDPSAGVKAQMFAGARIETPRSNNSPVWQFGDTTTTATDAMMRILTGSGSTDAYRAMLFGSGANQTSAVTKVVPYTAVFSTLYDAAVTGANEISLRENGVVTSVGSATDSGLTSFGSQILYIGRQATATGYINGKIYSLIVRFGANLDATAISNTETWVNGKTMAY